MALSNTAVPRYYGMFRDAVVRGEIPVCREVEMEMNRICRYALSYSHRGNHRKRSSCLKNFYFFQAEQGFDERPISVRGFHDVLIHYYSF